MTHAAGRLAASAAIDVVLKKVDKDREKGMLGLVDFIEKYMSGEQVDMNFEGVKDIISDPDSSLQVHEQSTG